MGRDDYGDLLLTLAVVLAFAFAASVVLDIFRTAVELETAVDTGPVPSIADLPPKTPPTFWIPVPVVLWPIHATAGGLDHGVLDPEPGDG
jgi:hypothetical protein